MDQYKEIREVLLQQPGRALSLNDMYDVIDKVIYTTLKSKPSRTVAYFAKYGPIIGKLEKSGILIPSPHAQKWKIKNKNDNKNI